MSGVLSMKKVFAIGSVFFLLAISFLISWLSYVKHLYLLFAFMMALYAVSILAVIGLVSYRTYMKPRIINPIKDLKRNYAKLYLGIRGGEVADENTLDLRGYSRNFHVDSLLAERYYSFLSPEGTLIIFTGKDKRYAKNTRISPLDYPLLHPVTLMENGIKPPKYLLYNPLIGFLFLWKAVFGNKRTDLSVQDGQTATIIEFCKARNVNIEFR